MSAPPIYSAILPGDYVVGSNYTRQFGTGDPLGSGTPQSSPFSIGIGGIPAGATIVKAYANWSYQTPTPFLGSAAEADIAINGTPVAGSLTGSAAPDLLWSQQGTDAYTADVTGIVTAAGGNGIYTVSGAVDSATPSSYGEGMSMLVVWALPGAPLQEVNVYSGLSTTESGPAVATYDFALGPYAGGPAHFFVNALDGQSQFTDQGLINGLGIEASGTIGGVGPAGNSWDGLVGLNPTSNIYDHAEGDSSPYMIAGDTFLTVQTLGAGNSGGLYSDAIGHSFGAMAFPVPEPATWTLALLGALALAELARRNRKHRN